MNRRKFIKTTLKAGIGASILSGLYAWQIEPFWLEFVKVKMPIKNLPDHLEGKTLMQLSDLHVGNRFDYEYLIEAFKEAQTYNPDFVVYTGDYVSYENEEQIQQLKIVMNHAVKGTFGTAGVLGNHDYGNGWKEQKIANNITEVLEENGIQILSNQNVNLKGLNIIGLDDLWGLNFNPHQVLKNINSNEANLVLCHNPDACDLNIWGNYQGWILSGHTHGGQVQPPFLDPLIVPVKNKKFTAGKIKLSNNRTLYINRALGHLWQVRFNVRPEISLFELTKK